MLQDANDNRWLDQLTRLIGKRSKLGKLLDGYRQLKEANDICSHFSRYLQPLIASNEDLKSQVFQIRHNVYCNELGFEPIRENGEETDEFDRYAKYCLIEHLNTQQYAGTVRIVTPQKSDDKLPIEKYCLDSITNASLNPTNFARQDICEVSRLAVPNVFRRRQMDRFAGAATGAINYSTYSETELRCFPFIAVGLYFSAAALAMHENIKHAYVMMEPRLARSMGFVGIRFEQIGPVVDYHGKRAPYYINQKLLYKSLTPGFRVMLEHIQKSIELSARNQ
ncbi:PEP-CTERM/exosortase system-associated acyltransferase [Alteromonas aestuariivivens]|uniref:PEP-CTERM/exosortase system-associated acyltransferase n=2 Tax=Alteromonas aestuariivivens TaxID=1938339 RepID=A0A3D8MFN3_9ALTE|nr:PEP-CTERM/exosortase system-associated acyltransferase [Alteromonas aestuariivivens]